MPAVIGRLEAHGPGLSAQARMTRARAQMFSAGG